MNARSFRSSPNFAWASGATCALSRSFHSRRCWSLAEKSARKPTGIFEEPFSEFNVPCGLIEAVQTPNHEMLSRSDWGKKSRQARRFQQLQGFICCHKFCWSKPFGFPQLSSKIDCLVWRKGSTSYEKQAYQVFCWKLHSAWKRNACAKRNRGSFHAQLK